MAWLSGWKYRQKLIFDTNTVLSSNREKLRSGKSCICCTSIGDLKWH